VRRNFFVVPRPLPAAPLVVHRSYLVAAPRPLPATPLVVRCRYLVVVHRLLPAAALVLHRMVVFIYLGAQAAARGGARCESKVLIRYPLAVARGAVQVVEHGGGGGLTHRARTQIPEFYVQPSSEKS
jgi:hypothetical protein